MSRMRRMFAWSPDGRPEKARIQWKEEDNLEMSKRGSVEDEWIDRETGRKGLWEWKSAITGSHVENTCGKRKPWIMATFGAMTSDSDIRFVQLRYKSWSHITIYFPAININLTRKLVVNNNSRTMQQTFYWKVSSVIQGEILIRVLKIKVKSIDHSTRLWLSVIQCENSPRLFVTKHPALLDIKLHVHFRFTRIMGATDMWRPARCLECSWAIMANCNKVVSRM